MIQTIGTLEILALPSSNMPDDPGHMNDREDCGAVAVVADENV